MKHLKLKLRVEYGSDLIEVYFNNDTKKHEYWYWEEEFYTGEVVRSFKVEFENFIELYVKEIESKLTSVKPLFCDTNIQPLMISYLNDRVNREDSCELMDRLFLKKDYNEFFLYQYWERILSLKWEEHRFMFIQKE